jgi:hypothetical protein
VSPHLPHIPGAKVERPTVAEVMVNIDSSELMFRGNYTATSLWPGK